MMAAKSKIVKYPDKKPAEILKWKVRQGSDVQKGSVLCTYRLENAVAINKLKAEDVGTVEKISVTEGTIVYPGTDLLELGECTHRTVMKDLCALCGANLRDAFGKPGERSENVSASVAMVHSVPELIVSEEEAKMIGREDQRRLLRDRKLVLLVDLDQTLLHTTKDNVPTNLKDVHHFQMWHGRLLMWYHTKFRPGIERFLQKISKLYELHICTFGVRMYAHSIARILDPQGQYFSHRILSRDECFNPTSKTANLRALFPCGDSMVAIIDDREDVWSFSPNLIHVRPYQFFYGTADINVPPGLTDLQMKQLPKTDANREQRIVKVPRKKTTSNHGISEDSVIKEGDSEKSANNKLDCESSENGSQKQKVILKDSHGSHEKGNEIGAKGNEDDTSDTVVLGENDGSIKVGNGPSMDLDEGEKVEEGSISEEKTAKTNEHMESENTVELPYEIILKENSENTVSKASENPHVKEDGELSLSDDSEEGKTEIKTDKKILAENKADNEVEYDEMVEWIDHDDYLLYLEDILVRIHQAFYELYDQTKDREKEEELPSLKKIIPYVRRKTLQGTNIVFSGLPTNRPIEQSRKFHLAQTLGANVQNDFVSPYGSNDSSTTTHVVACRPGTQKVRMASKYKNVHIVNHDWLFASADRWERVDETLFSRISELGPDELKQDLIPVPSVKRKNEDEPGTFEDGERIGKDPKNARLESESGEGDALVSGASYDNGLKLANNKNESDVPQPSTSSENIENRRFSDSYNPILAFSKADMDDMDKEVEDILDSSDSENEDSAENELRVKVLNASAGRRNSSSEESLGGNFPKGWKKKLHKKRPRNDEDDNADEDDDEGKVDDDNQVPDQPHRIMRHSSDSDSDLESDKESFDESVGSVDEEMAAAVEKEFLDF